MGRPGFCCTNMRFFLVGLQYPREVRKKLYKCEDLHLNKIYYIHSVPSNIRQIQMLSLRGRINTLRLEAYWYSGVDQVCSTKRQIGAKFGVLCEEVGSGQSVNKIGFNARYLTKPVQIYCKLLSRVMFWSWIMTIVFLANSYIFTNNFNQTCVIYMYRKNHSWADK